MPFKDREKRNEMARIYYRTYRDKNREKLRERNRLRGRARYAKDPKKSMAISEKSRLKRLFREYGVTRPKPELCEVPGCTRAATRLDHCHDSGKFRGWLCHPHNVTLGMLGDSVDKIKNSYAALMSYLLPT
jgi:hypothetical protein